MNDRDYSGFAWLALVALTWGGLYALVRLVLVPVCVLILGEW